MINFDGEAFSLQFRRFFHNLPRINICFYSVNSTFDLTSGTYLESLGILSSIPAFILILTLVGLLAYLIIQCTWGKESHIICGKVIYWGLIILSAICFVCISFGFYGNEITHWSILKTTEHLNSISLKISIDIVKQNIIQRIDPQLNIAEGDFKKQPSNDSLHELFSSMHRNVSLCQENVSLLSQIIHKINISSSIKEVYYWESVRWSLTIGIFCLFVLFCIILLIGLAKNSKKVYMIFSVLGLLGLVTGWSSSSICLAFTIGFSDFCESNDEFLSIQMSSWLPSVHALYYLHCPDTASPYFGIVNNASVGMKHVKHMLHSTESLAHARYPREDVIHQNLGHLSLVINSTASILDSLIPEFHCHFVQQHYSLARKSFCVHVFMGIVFMFVSFLILAVIFTLLVWLDSYVWIHNTGCKDRYIQVIDNSDVGHSFPNDVSHPYWNDLSRNLNAQTSHSSGTLKNGIVRSHVEVANLNMLNRPNNGEFPTLSKQCKTLESSLFY